MCFSATASFTVAAGLAPVGLFCLHRARRDAPRSLMFAAFPLLFALQQATEGFVWLHLAEHMAQPGAAAYGFLFFSHFFWLWWVPMAAWFLEPDGPRRHICAAITVLGVLYGLSLFVPLLLNADWLRVMVLDHSISYRVTLIYQDVLAREWVHGLYAICVISPLLLQSDFHVRVFGGIVLASMVIASQEFTQAYISVWCFFAAVASAYLLFMVPQHGRIQVREAAYGSAR